jgi:hypothetical protein
MAGIRVNSGNIKVEVNDNGDVIILRKDINFINKVNGFINGLDNVKAEYNKKVESISENEPDYEDKVLDCIYELHKELHDGIDFLFGKDTCKKVFGEGVEDVIPTLDGVIEFFEQISPYITNLAKSMTLGNKSVPAKYANVTPMKPVGYMGEAPKQSNTGVFSSLRQQLDNSGDDNNEV